MGIEIDTRLAGLISDAICREGPMPFSRFMELALYAPELGYYERDHAIFGSSGDYITAPGLTPLFGKAFAGQIAAVLEHTGGSILEIGAGEGSLAENLLDSLPDTPYAILERSQSLIARQKIRLADRGVSWLEDIPESFVGAVIANEVLDAMPVEVVQWRSEGLFQLWVGEGYQALWQPMEDAAGTIAEEARRLPPSPPYQSEIGLIAADWVAEAMGRLKQGVMFFIDYGFGEAEYYHPQRREGTLFCHHRHRVHDQVLADPGSQDITAHVDFSRIARAAKNAGGTVLGFTTQAAFLINAGLLDLVPVPPSPREAQALNMLLSPAEMGELFKVLALAKDIDLPLTGFGRHDRRYQLELPAR